MLQAAMPLATARPVCAGDAAARKQSSWTVRPADMTEAAWEGADASNARAAAAAKYSFMFHSPECGPSFKIAIHPGANLSLSRDVRMHKARLERKKDSIGAGLGVFKH